MAKRARQNDDPWYTEYDNGQPAHMGDITSLDNEPPNLDFKPFATIGFVRPKEKQREIIEYEKTNDNECIADSTGC
jgi:hypothetical protein